MNSCLFGEKKMRRATGAGTIKFFKSNDPSSNGFLNKKEVGSEAIRPSMNNQKSVRGAAASGSVKKMQKKVK